jgi:hypothetical protein
MGNGTATSRERGSRGFIARLVAVACLGALAGWVLPPTGATGQQYQIPTVAPTTTTAPAAPPPVAPLPLLSPFPIVRIVGVATARGARIRVFTVRATVGGYVVSRCIASGNRCSYKQRSTRIGGTKGAIRTVHVRGFERSFRAGVLLRVYVVAAGRTGKFTSFKIRRNLAPRRNDGCVADVLLRPVTCPAG